MQNAKGKMVDRFFILNFALNILHFALPD